MKTLILFVMVLLFTSPFFVHAQTNEWMTQYVTLDDEINGTREHMINTLIKDANSTADWIIEVSH